MKPPAVLVPFKGERLKSRLTPVLDGRQREEVAFLLLNHTLRAVAGAGMGGHCYVISSDPRAWEAAKAAGASFVQETAAKGVNGAVKLAVRALTRHERFMVIPSDLPLLAPADLKKAEALGAAKEVVISPSAAFNGTNLLLFARGLAPRLSYDSNSFWNHLASAARFGLSVAVTMRPGITFDLDTPADVDELLDLGVNTRVARFLRKSLAK